VMYLGEGMRVVVCAKEEGWVPFTGWILPREAIYFTKFYLSPFGINVYSKLPHFPVTT